VTGVGHFDRPAAILRGGPLCVWSVMPAHAGVYSR
jgi:hypothetical protein